MSTHYIEETENLLNSILLIKDGKLIFNKTIAEIQQLAIKVSGKTADVLSFIEPYYEFVRETSADSAYTTSYIEHSIHSSLLRQGQINGLSIQPLSIKEVCHLFSKKKKGRVEDVFETSNSI